jgi:hypothetical protein
MSCQHLTQIQEVTPSAQGCEECLKSGSWWVHLRLCLICGPCCFCAFFLQNTSALPTSLFCFSDRPVHDQLRFFRVGLGTLNVIPLRE